MKTAREQLIALRVSNREARAIQTEAQKAKCSKSEWIRRQVRRGAGLPEAKETK